MQFVACQLAILGLLALPNASSGAQTRLPDVCVGSAQIKVADLPEIIPASFCNLVGRQIKDEGIGAVVPPEGTKVYAEGMAVNGAEEFEIVHHEDGTIELNFVGDDGGEFDSEFEEVVEGSPADNQCTDGAYNDKDEKIDEAHPWRYNPDDRPSNLNATSTLDAIRDAGSNMTHVDNVCGHGDNVSAQLSYQGTTNSKANIDVNANCGGGDGLSEVSWGDLPSRYLGYSCTWEGIERIGYDEIREMDVKLNEDKTWTNTPHSSGCETGVNNVDVEALMTHERGHSLGLGHPGDSHTTLTMHRVVGGCQTSERTLGKGDWKGLEAKY